MIVSNLYVYLNEGDNVRKSYCCLKMVIQTHLHLVFFTMLFIKHELLKRFYLFMKVLQSSTIFKRKIIMKCIAIKSFA